MMKLTPLIIPLGRKGAVNRTVDYLGILSDPEYMAGVREKLNSITTYFDVHPYSFENKSL
jgi:hypothetical protein